MEALTLTQHCLRKKKMYMKNYDMFLFRLDLDEISAKTQKHQLFNTKFVIKSSFPIKVKIGGELLIAEDPRRRPILVSLPNSPPIKRYGEKQNSIHKTSSYEKYWVFCDAPLNFASFDLKC